MTETDAIGIAEQVAAANGWTWLEPVHASLKRSFFTRAKHWEVVSNSGSIGCNVRILIDDRDGAIVKAVFCPR